MHERAVLLLHRVSLAAVRPIEATVRVQARTMAVGAVGGPGEAVHEELALLGHAVVVRIGELPDTGGRGDEQAAIGPATSLGYGKFVREDGAAFEHAVAVPVLEHEDAVREDGFELLRAPIHASGVAYEEAATVIDASHGGIGYHWRGGGDDHFKTHRELVLQPALRELILAELEEARAVGIGREFLAVTMAGRLGGAPLLLELA